MAAPRLSHEPRAEAAAAANTKASTRAASAPRRSRQQHHPHRPWEGAPWLGLRALQNQGEIGARVAPDESRGPSAVLPFLPHPAASSRRPASPMTRPLELPFSPLEESFEPSRASPWTKGW